MVEILEKEGKLFFSFSGRLDTRQCWEIEALIYPKIEERSLPVVFGLKGVDFIASAFLRICFTIFKKLGRDKFTLINLRPMVKKSFEMAGYYERMKRL